MKDWFLFLKVSKLNRNWFVSLIAGDIVLFILVFCIQMRAINIIREDKVRETGQAIKILQKNVDRQLQNLKELGVMLLLHKSNLTLQHSKNKEDFTKNKAYLFTELLYNIKSANTLVEDIYIYYPSNEYIIGTKGSYTAKQ